MEIGGPDIATISGLGPPIPSSQLTLQLLAPTDPSISQHPEPTRTLLTMPAGANIWTLTPEVTSLPIGTLSAAPGLFTAIAIEAGEGPAGDTERELLATIIERNRTTGSTTTSPHTRSPESLRKQGDTHRAHIRHAGTLRAVA